MSNGYMKKSISWYALWKRIGKQPMYKTQNTKSNITSKEYDNKYRIEWYLFADEAKTNGFTDYIIGEDCDIDKII